LKLPVLLVAMAAALMVAGEAEACRVYRSPMPIYEGWFNAADGIVLGRVVSIGEIQEPDEGGRTWSRPVMEVEPVSILRGASSSGRISIRGEDLVSSCEPTLAGTISSLKVGDDVLVMLDEKQTAFGLIEASSDVAQSYVARLTPPVE
jgi:hypothetical protein